MFSKLAATALGLMVALGLAVSASATTGYESQDPAASVSSTTVAPGGSVTFTAGGFGPGTPVAVTAVLEARAAGEVSLVAAGTGRLGAGLVVVQSAPKSFSATADSSGSVSVPVTLGSAGNWTITATGVDADGNPRSVSTTVLVSADAAGPAGSGSGSAAGSGSEAKGGVLARTGIDSVATTLWVAFGVLVLGGVLVAVASGRGRTRQDA